MTEESGRLIRKWAPLLDRISENSQVLAAARFFENIETHIGHIEHKSVIIPLARRLFDRLCMFDNGIHLLGGNTSRMGMVEYSYNTIDRKEDGNHIHLVSTPKTSKAELKELSISMEGVSLADDRTDTTETFDDVILMELSETLRSKLADKIGDTDTEQVRSIKGANVVYGDNYVNTMYDFMLQPYKSSTVSSNVGLVLGYIYLSKLNNNDVLNLKYSIVELI